MVLSFLKTVVCDTLMIQYHRMLTLSRKKYPKVPASDAGHRMRFVGTVESEIPGRLLCRRLFNAHIRIRETLKALVVRAFLLAWGA